MVQNGFKILENCITLLTVKLFYRPNSYSKNNLRKPRMNSTAVSRG